MTSASYESRVTGVSLVTFQCFKLKTSTNVFEVRRRLTRSVLPIISNEIPDVRYAERRTSSNNGNAMVSISLNDCNQAINQSINQTIIYVKDTKENEVRSWSLDKRSYI